MTAIRKKNDKVDVERAKLAPANEFENPEDVAKACGIDKHDKKKILSQWETDANALSRAGDEGMAGDEPPRLDEVEKARKKVGAVPSDKKAHKQDQK